MRVITDEQVRSNSLSLREVQQRIEIEISRYDRIREAGARYDKDSVTELHRLFDLEAELLHQKRNRKLLKYPTNK